MTMSSTSNSTYSTGMVSSLRRGLVTVCLLTLAGVVGLVVITGPQVQAALEANKARVLDQENRAFCAKRGIGPETARLAECAADLNTIRLHHEQRSADLFF
jgi:hypothetical protein